MSHISIPRGRSIRTDVFTDQGGTPDTGVGPRTDLPPIAKDIPSKPPMDFPTFDPAKPADTDFQLQQALVVAKAMVTTQHRRSN